MKKVLFLISIVLVVGMFAALAYAATPDEIFKVADDADTKEDAAQNQICGQGDHGDSFVKSPVWPG